MTGGNAAITSGVGSAGSPTFSGATMSVPLSGVSDRQKITVSLTGIRNGLGQVFPDTSVEMVVLEGDTNADTRVNIGDTNQTKSASGQLTNAANARTDMNLDGRVNIGDTNFVKSHSGNSVP
jgi:hypothetical protein